MTRRTFRSQPPALAVRCDVRGECGRYDLPEVNGYAFVTVSQCGDLRRVHLHTVGIGCQYRDLTHRIRIGLMCERIVGQEHEVGSLTRLE